MQIPNLHDLSTEIVTISLNKPILISNIDNEDCITSTCCLVCKISHVMFYLKRNQQYSFGSL